MQSQNRNARKIAVVFAVVVIVVFVVTIIVLVSKPHPSQNTAQETVYHDPYSGETVTDIKGKGPDTYGVNPEEPVFLGISKLLDNGISSTQLEDYKQAVYNYSLHRNPKIQEISIHVNDIKRPTRDPNSDIDTLTFDVTINRKDTYQARFDYSLLTIARLTLSQNGKQIFDSGNIDVTTQTDSGGD